MANNHAYTHFKGEDISRCEKVERKVVEIILASPKSDEERAWSKTFELKHNASVAQIGRILAQKRGLSDEIAAIVCVLHDIYVFATGEVKDHGPNGVSIAENILREIGGFTEEEIKLITKAVASHSDKHIVSDDPYVELVKDADVLDCSLLIGVRDAYIYEKSPEMCKFYFERIKSVRRELGLPPDPQWDL